MRSSGSKRPCLMAAPLRPSSIYYLGHAQDHEKIRTREAIENSNNSACYRSIYYLGHAHLVGAWAGGPGSDPGVQATTPRKPTPPQARAPAGGGGWVGGG